MAGRSRRDARTGASALAAAALALAGLVAACGGGDERGAAPPTRGADVDGEVRSVTPTPGGGVVALIVPPGDPCGVATTVEPGDRVLVETADGLEKVDVDALRRGGSARAWLDTPIAESCPAQAGASDVVIAEAAP